MISDLAHWIWQGLVLVAAVSLCLARARHVSASMRYGVWWATLALVLALPFLSLLDLPGWGALLGVAGPVELLAADSPGPSPAPSNWIAWIPFASLASWIVWSATRFYVALAHLDAIKRACRPFPVVRERALLQWKAVRNRGRRATLVVSDHVRAGAVLGLGYPRIAIAPELVSSLSDDELDQLVLHEYAHVQRRDDLASVVQLLVKALVGWHPAVWWIDRRLRIEREVACDDWVLATTGAPRTYARCLTRIADLAMGFESSLIPAASCPWQLTTRVLRLLDGRRNTSIRPSRLALAAAAVMLAIVSIGLTGSHAPAIALPPVARAGSAPIVDRPGLTFARLWQTLTEPTAAASTRRSRGSEIDALRAADRAAQADVVRAVAVPPGSDLSTSDAIPTPMETDPEAHPVSPVEPSHVVTADTSPNASAPPPVATTVGDDARSVGADDESSWVENTGRALAEAGKTTGQSIAEAGVNTGAVVADAGVAAARGTQQGVVKAGRFFSRLGRKLVKPF